MYFRKCAAMLLALVLSCAPAMAETGGLSGLIEAQLSWYRFTPMPEAELGYILGCSSTTRPSLHAALPLCCFFACASTGQVRRPGCARLNGRKFSKIWTATDRYLTIDKPQFAG